jgi:hypothetical protein
MPAKGHSKPAKADRVTDRAAIPTCNTAPLRRGFSHQIAVDSGGYQQAVALACFSLVR